MRKRVLLVADGMADYRLAELGDRTPIEAAATPNLDAVAAVTHGLAQTVPAGFLPGSDVANLAMLGYDPAAVYTGRSPLEAASIGVDLGPNDIAYRCNLVTIEDGIMVSHTASGIGNDEARSLLDLLQARLGDERFEFHYGLGYRHLLVWRGGEQAECTPPHNILDQPVAGYRPQGPAAAELATLTAAANEVLATERPHTEIWLWGQGTAPRVPLFVEQRGLRGAVVAAVDLVRGIGRCAGLDVLDAPGATGDLDTDYVSKATVGLAALERYDFVFIHVEAPDEASHLGDVGENVKAIEQIDREILGRILASPLQPAVLVAPDHYTLVKERVHISEPVPFAFNAVAPGEHSAATRFSEAAAAGTGLRVLNGPALMDLFLAATA
ncbi:MAG: cofactor-independent phosphoglycerate mutase [Thermoleophilia bacterium]